MKWLRKITVAPQDCKGSVLASHHTPPAFEKRGLIGYKCTRCGDFVFDRIPGVDVDTIKEAGDALIAAGRADEAMRVRDAAIARANPTAKEEQRAD